MAYYVKFKGLGHKTVVRERATKPEALKLVDYLARHGIQSKHGLILDDGSHGKAQ